MKCMDCQDFLQENRARNITDVSVEYYIRHPLELINTSRELLEQIFTDYENILKGTIIFDPCADQGNVLEVAGNLGYENYGYDINPSTHERVLERKDLFTLTDSLKGQSVLTILNWGDYNGTNLKKMAEHLATLYPEVIINTMGPVSLGDYTPPGYELYDSKVIPKDKYIVLENGATREEEYLLSVWTIL